MSIIATINFAIFQQRKSLPGTWLSLENGIPEKEQRFPYQSVK